MEIANYVDKVRPGVYFVGEVVPPQMICRTDRRPHAPELALVAGLGPGAINQRPATPLLGLGFMFCRFV